MKIGMKIDKSLYNALKKMRQPGMYNKIDGAPLWLFFQSISRESHVVAVANDIAMICGLIYSIVVDEAIEMRTDDCIQELTSEEQSIFKSDIYSSYHVRSGKIPPVGSTRIGNEWRVSPTLFLAPSSNGVGRELIAMAGRDICEKPTPNYSCSAWYTTPQSSHSSIQSSIDTKQPQSLLLSTNLEAIVPTSALTSALTPAPTPAPTPSHAS